MGREQRHGAEEERAEVGVDEDGLAFAVAEDDGDGMGIEAGVDVVDDAASHGHRELELIHGGDVGREHGHDGAWCKSEGGDGGGGSEASGLCLRPGVGGGVVDKGGGVAVYDCCSLKECERGEWTGISRAPSQLVHELARILVMLQMQYCNLSLSLFR